MSGSVAQVVRRRIDRRAVLVSKVTAIPIKSLVPLIDKEVDFLDGLSGTWIDWRTNVRVIDERGVQGGSATFLASDDQNVGEPHGVPRAFQ